MEGIVAKRTLKKSYYNNKSIKDIQYGSIPFVGVNDHKSNKSITREKNSLTKWKEKMLYKVAIQAITMISLITFVLAVKYLKINIVIESDVVKKIVAYYQKSYSAREIIDGSKEFIKTCYVFAKPIIPETAQNKAKELYKILITKQQNVEEDIQNNNEDIKNNEVIIYEEVSFNNQESSQKENIGISVNGNEDEEKVVAVSSSISSEYNILDEIKETKIQFVKPVSGKVTSHFGAREVIFEGVDSYHTGTDIAASTGTKIVSSIEGKVTRATYNKYNGNFVEVTNGDISTIYCHMNKISVKVGDKVKAGTKIGEVGSTGLSTGPHLHFEIVYGGTKIDPELVVNL